MLKPRPSLLAAGAVLMMAGAARADPQALSTNIPVEIEDALPTGRGVLTLQPDQRYTRDRSMGTTTDLGQPELVFKLGAAKHLQLDFSPSYSWGNASSAAQGQTSLGALYQFTEDKGWAPDLAVHAFYRVGYGHDAPSDQTTLRALMTKRLGSTDQAPRLHLNLTWTRVLSPTASARDDQYSVGAGYSMLVSKDTAVVADFVHSQRPARHAPDQNLVDVGFIHQFNTGWSASFGAGGGVTSSSPEGRIFVGLQRNFKLF